MTLRTALAGSTLAIAFLFAACAGPEEDGAEKSSSVDQAAAVAVFPPAPPPQPPQDPVLRQCLLDALEGYAQCRCSNQESREACSDKYDAAHRACRVAATPPPPPPPPPPPVRRDPQCVSAARQAFAECVRANPAAQAACGERFEAAYAACPPATTPPPPPPPPPPVPGSR